MGKMNIEGRLHRAVIVNTFLTIIATTGRKFFSCDDRIAKFVVTETGLVYYNDAFKGTLARAVGKTRWSNFTHGSSLFNFAIRLRDYITDGKKIPLWALVWAEDNWAYGEDFQRVLAAAHQLDLVESA